MSSERWVRAWELFDQAAPLPPEQRLALLDEACRHDPAVRRSVERWLRADASAADFLENDWLSRDLLVAPNLVGTKIGSLSPSRKDWVRGEWAPSTWRTRRPRSSIALSR